MDMIHTYVSDWIVFNYGVQFRYTNWVCLHLTWTPSFHDAYHQFSYSLYSPIHSTCVLHFKGVGIITLLWSIRLFPMGIGVKKTIGLFRNVRTPNWRIMYVRNVRQKVPYKSWGWMIQRFIILHYKSFHGYSRVIYKCNWRLQGFTVSYTWCLYSWFWHSHDQVWGPQPHKNYRATGRSLEVKQVIPCRRLRLTSEAATR